MAVLERSKQEDPTPTLKLYYPTIYPCSCCGLDRTFIFLSQTDQTVCAECKRHSQDLEKRIVLHRDWWMAHQDEMQREKATIAASHQARVAELDAKVQDLGAKVNDLDSVIMDKYDDTPLGGVREWLRDVAILPAESKTEAAYRSRDRAMATLWKLDHLHRGSDKRDAKGAPMCFCQSTVAKCKEREALSPIIPMLDNWEKKQEGYLARGLTHGLPKEHPKVLAQSRRYGTYS